eukprot:TRINITY_DN15869_c0_g1_i1.p1 TRINITY_DN15869_c0_g1~~TRINITY_DN15869_c0_g1_i1.p1  ORF type:complete len:404 (+),score=89.78 TRINITY_DN15869_c0_g1_i1:61-1272(+)
MGDVMSAAAMGGAVGGCSGSVLYFAMDEEERSQGRFARTAEHCTACAAGAAGGVACLPLHLGLGASLVGAAGPGTVLCEMHRACGANVLTGFMAACHQHRAQGANFDPDDDVVMDAQGLVYPDPSRSPILSRFSRPPPCSYADSLPGVFKIPGALCRWVPGGAAGDAAVVGLYFHEAGSDLGTCAEECAALADTLGGPVIAVEYCGYGRADAAEGEAWEQVQRCVDATAIAALTHITATLRVPSERVVVVGRAEGSGPACLCATAARAGVGGLILLDPVASARNGADGWSTLRLVRLSTAPVLLLAGAEDCVDAEWLFVAASSTHKKGEATLTRYYVPGKKRGEITISDCAHTIVGPLLGMVSSRLRKVQPIPRGALQPPPKCEDAEVLPRLATRLPPSAGAA